MKYALKYLNLHYGSTGRSKVPVSDERFKITETN